MSFLTPSILAALAPTAPAMASLLQAHSVCSVCILRLLCVRKLALFVSLTSTPTPSSPTHSHTTPGSPHSPTCPACLGLLQPRLVHAAVAKAQALVAAQPIQAASSFLIAARVPPQLAMRARILNLLMQQHGHETTKVALREPKRYNLKSKNQPKPEKEVAVIHTDTSDNEPFSIVSAQIEVKEVLRIVLQHLFAVKSGWAFDPNSPLALEIGFDHPATDAEYEFMQALPQCNLLVKKKRKRVREGSVWRKMGDDEPQNMRVEGAKWNDIVEASEAIGWPEFLREGLIPVSIGADATTGVSSGVSTDGDATTGKFEVQEDCAVAELRFLHQSLWIAGRYNKYDRTISNSRMEFNGKRLAEESVEEVTFLHSSPLNKTN
ncbi:hypothetical protein HDU98_010821 [Podochytrium sp. JEL0797]|nr:hypothetical protein HDU98_010821 [Podochytrium sp. JEL0797]